MTTKTFQLSEDLDNTWFYCGLDVHKHQLAVCIYAKDEAGLEFIKNETFGTDPASLEAFFAFTMKYKPRVYGMEATNVYHHVVASLLQMKKDNAGWRFRVVIFNPADASGIPGRHKSDRLDSTMIAKYLEAGLLKAGKPINLVLEDMRAIFRMAHRLERDRTALKNRIKKTLDRAGIRPVGFNFNRQWVMSLVHALCNHVGTLGELLDGASKNPDIPPKHVRFIRKNSHLFEKFRGIALTHVQNALLNQNMAELDFKTARISLLAVEVDAMVAKRPGLRQTISNVASIPGMSIFSAAWLVAESGPIQRYDSHRKFTAYCGCCERTVKSAGKTYSAHQLRRSNKFIRYILFNTAKVWCYIYKEKGPVRDYCKRVLAKKGSRSWKLACCTIATKISRVVYAILKNGTEFDPTLGGNNKRPASLKWSMLTIADARKVKNAMKALKRVESMKHLLGLSENAALLAKYFERALHQKSP